MFNVVWKLPAEIHMCQAIKLCGSERKQKCALLRIVEVSTDPKMFSYTSLSFFSKLPSLLIAAFAKAMASFRIVAISSWPLQEASMVGAATTELIWQTIPSETQMNDTNDSIALLRVWKILIRERFEV